MKKIIIFFISIILIISTIYLLDHRKNISGNYYKDFFNVYIKIEVPFPDENGNMIENYVKLKDADMKTFTPLEWYYSKDKNHVYCSKSEIEEANSISFETLGYWYAKDNKNIYYCWWTDFIKKSTKMDVDYNTFKVLDPLYTKDKNHVYYIRKILENVDPETFETLDYPYAKDKNNVYTHDWKILDKAEPNTFEILSSRYSKDKNRVYYSSYIKTMNIEWADSETFQVLDYKWAITDKEEKFFAKDKENIYYMRYQADKHDVHYQNIKLETWWYYIERWVDLESFIALNEDFSKDKNNVYYRWFNLIKEADIDTFETFKWGYYAKDKKNVYYNNNNRNLEIISNADASTFKFIDFYTAKDSNNCYVFWKIKDMSRCEEKIEYLKKENN